ncbi:3-deoxy-D-manno-octulosonic acid transferase [Bythopirellula polymerisocia]|uniref:3-deoxy-D-manno-octulosonic acid transferase n=1 Tax=Bythopirellula polymerisocia TaxID=2528003 RepID=A0A5C6CKJ3_9BACT|nr:3-deoxy-D-manno-octulosonic acid transferase [Bythopirellula polymerisocia]TWU23646.1 3-deoxy-D-manno-octulosonic acid transferase [Bythopirellula polymerisocia]
MSRIQKWLLNAAYLGAITFALPWILWSAWRHGKYREGFSEKFWGNVPQRTSNRPCIWLHAVSVGEVNLLSTMICEIANKRPEVEIVISTTTKTGYDLARKKYAAHAVFYCPLDFSWAVKRAILRIRPDLLVLAELELWPQLISMAKEQGVRVAIINGRLSDKSLRGYLRVRHLISRIFARVDLIAAQNKETAERFRRLGACCSAVQVSGSLKFDGALIDRANARSIELHKLAGFTENDLVLLAGSTQDPEEAIVIRVYRHLKNEFPRLRLVLVPRHPQRFDEVAALLKHSGLPWICRSKLDDAGLQRSHSEIILVDTIGELGAWWGLADFGFVGGSFGNRGGQNMIEPAAFGVATCFGPNTWNFRDIVSQLIGAEGAVVVENEQQLEKFVRRALEQPAWATGIGERAQSLVLAQQGATERTIQLLMPLVEEFGAKRNAA